MNDRTGFGDKNPKLEIIKEGLTLWNIFTDIIHSVFRIDTNSGYYVKIPPSEFKAYNDMKALQLTPYEYDVLTSMDTAFCEEMNKDVKAKQDRAKSDAESKRKGK